MPASREVLRISTCAGGILQYSTFQILTLGLPSRSNSGILHPTQPKCAPNSAANSYHKMCSRLACKVDLGMTLSDGTVRAVRRSRPAIPEYEQRGSGGLRVLHGVLWMSVLRPSELPLPGVQAGLRLQLNQWGGRR